MKVEDIIKVLALFDEEDIPYIKSDILLNAIQGPKPKEEEKPKEKKIGVKNDRFRK